MFSNLATWHKYSSFWTDQSNDMVYFWLIYTYIKTEYMVQLRRLKNNLNSSTRQILIASVLHYTLIFVLFCSRGQMWNLIPVHCIWRGRYNMHCFDLILVYSGNTIQYTKKKTHRLLYNHLIHSLVRSVLWQVKVSE